MSKNAEFHRGNVFSEDFNKIFNDACCKPVLLESENFPENDGLKNLKENSNWKSENSENTLQCSLCKIAFLDVFQQREHYKLDWHRYNLRQSLRSKLSISEEEFSTKTINDEVSSLSGSDSEDNEEKETLDTVATAQGKIFFQNSNGKIFSMYRVIFLRDKKDELNSINFNEQYEKNCWNNNKQWGILMLGGGHFAGAIFQNLQPILHKTFHCYTVRAGQGGQQSAKDNKNAGSHPKSAGASLRRYNEQALVDHVRSIIGTWSDELKKCNLIFYRASGPYNRTVLFGGKDPVLERTDPKLRTIPFSTGRATFTEVKRVFAELSSVKFYGSINEASSFLSKQLLSEKESKRNRSRLGSVNRAKSRESSERPLPGHEENISSVIINEKSSSDEEEFELREENLEISFEELAEFGDSLTAEQRNKKRSSKKKPKKSKAKKLREFEEGRKKLLVDTLIKGNTLILQELFDQRVKTFDDSLLINRQELAQEFFNEILDEHGNSFLHLAVMNEHEELLKYLLENEADPCVKNKSQQTAYSCSQSRISREILRKFATENPEKYNYNKAQIPLNVLTDEELAEKKRAQRKIKREKEKEKKKELAVKQQEQDQKNRFINLSDSEKRALAAERRILNAQGKVIARCFLCGSDIAGKVPFQYLENRFCSVPCLQSHRLKSTLKI